MSFKCQIFADGADLSSITELAQNPLISGFTTNPTLMKAAGVKDYIAFCRNVIEIVGHQPLSLEVFSDDFEDMNRQAHLLSALGPSVFVKIPITNTKGESSLPLVRQLCEDGIQVNVTAVFTKSQIADSIETLKEGPDSFLSIFAGRIADAGVDPIPTIEFAVQKTKALKNVKLIWASPRELLNIVQASETGCHVITVTPELLKKVNTIGKDLDEFSLDTVKMFANDALAAGYEL